MNPQNMLSKLVKKVPKPFNSIIEIGDQGDYFEGLNIERPQSLTPMEMELRIQADRVMFALNKATSVLTVMVSM